MNIDRTTALEMLLRALPPRGPERLGTLPHEIGVMLRIAEVQGALPFLHSGEQLRAQAWLAEAYAVQRTFKGSAAWQANPAPL
jgi:hypothetical protein